MSLSDFLNLAALIIIPIAAVAIGHWMQTNSEKRKDKMQIFKTLMTARLYGWTVDSVQALNMIDIVFAKDKEVRAAWKALFDAYSSTEQSELMAKKRQDLMYKLIEEIANNLGYKDTITWEEIQNPYLPQALVNQWATQAQAQQTYSQVLCSMKDMLPNTQNKEGKENYK